ncbi:MAG: SIS domain-containing protein [Gammaproteobacteria bacterium]|nr:SIS domain-containing protein [Gammaproteobacteria bacterium]MCP4879511.1 SIS domain-containing protein [Gammaproteobacteria bacterium]MDP6166445.1 SIS domain-containing protein [Gammaproteobacteria bacterium]
MTNDLFKTLQAAYEKLRKSEKKVADYVLQEQASVVQMRIVDLAAAAAVSEPTVVRFCRALGFDGFQDFKLTLAQSVATSSSYQQFRLDSRDSVEEFKEKIFDSTMGNLMRVKHDLDAENLESAIQALTQTRRVDCYGFGASAPICSDAQHKFFRLNMSAMAYSDPHLQTMAAVTLQAGDVVIAISQTGRTRDLLHTTQLALNAGATVIALCPSDTPLAELAQIPLHIDLEGDKELGTLMSSRITQMVVIDVLAVGVTMKLGADTLAHLKTIKRSLKGLRTPSKRK